MECRNEGGTVKKQYRSDAQGPGSPWGGVQSNLLHISEFFYMSQGP